jgi:hypothetical protein
LNAATSDAFRHEKTPKCRAPFFPPVLIRPDITLRRAGINSGPPAAYLSCTTKVVMQMIDWNTYRQQVVAGVGGFAKLSPETVKGYGAMGGAGQKTGQLDAKTRELIAIAVAITLPYGVMAVSPSTPTPPINSAQRRRRSRRRWASLSASTPVPPSSTRPARWMRMPPLLKPDLLLNGVAT